MTNSEKNSELLESWNNLKATIQSKVKKLNEKIIELEIEIKDPLKSMPGGFPLDDKNIKNTPITFSAVETNLTELQKQAQQVNKEIRIWDLTSKRVPQEQARKKTNRPKKWVTFEKEGDIWKFVERIKNDIFVLKKLDKEVKLFNVPKSFIYENYDDHKFIVDTNHSSSKNTPFKELKGGVVSPIDDYELLILADQKTINVDGFEVRGILLPEDSGGWHGFMPLRERKAQNFVIRVLPNQNGIFNYCLGKLYVTGGYPKTTLEKEGSFIYFYNPDREKLSFYNERVNPDLWALKFSKITEEKASKLIADDIFYLDCQNSAFGEFNWADKSLVKAKGVLDSYKERMFLIRSEFRTRKKV